MAGGIIQGSVIGGGGQGSGSEDALRDGEAADAHHELGEVHSVEGVKRAAEVGESFGGDVKPLEH